jgi:hypothetical protein
MRVDWSELGRVVPQALVSARHLAHHALQWPTRAARANLPAVPDDSHSALLWDAARSAFVSQPFGNARVGVRITDLALLFLRASDGSETFSLAGRADAEVRAWLDQRLAGSGLKPASGVKLPYKLETAATGQPAAGELQELARWFALSADVLEETRRKLAPMKPSPAFCWPHHFDIAITVELGGDPARSVGMGVSPGDEHYAQPYAYVSPYPRPQQEAALPALAAGGTWHTSGFLGAVMRADEMLARGDARAALLAFVAAAFEACREVLSKGR